MNYIGGMGEGFARQTVEARIAVQAAAKGLGTPRISARLRWFVRDLLMLPRKHRASDYSVRPFRNA